MTARRMIHAVGVVVATVVLAQCDKIPTFGDGGEGSSADENSLVREIEAADFDNFTAIKNKLVVVDFHADWCGPCKTLGPKLEAIAEEFDGQVVVGKINVDNAKQLAARLGVNGIPDVRIFRNGTQVDRFVGDIPKTEIRTKIDAHTVFLKGTDGEGDGETAEPAVEPIQPMNKDWIPEGIQKR